MRRVRWTAIASVRISGNEIDIVRCAVCGVRMWHEPLSAPQLVIIAVGTLDDPSWAVPTSHIFARSVSPGVVLQDDALVLQDGPSDRKAVFDAFNRDLSDVLGAWPMRVIRGAVAWRDCGC